MVAGGQIKKLGAHIFIQTQEAERELEVKQSFVFSKPTSTEVLSPASLYLLKVLKFLKQHHQPGTKCSNK